MQISLRGVFTNHNLNKSIILSLIQCSRPLYKSLRNEQQPRKHVAVLNLELMIFENFSGARENWWKSEDIFDRNCWKSMFSSLGTI